MADRAERFTGHDPLDPTSFLQLRAIDSTRLEFDGRASRIYDLEYTPGLLPSAWSLVVSNLPGIEGPMHISIPGPMPGVYRLRVR